MFDVLIPGIFGTASAVAAAREAAAAKAAEVEAELRRRAHAEAADLGRTAGDAAAAAAIERAERAVPWVIGAWACVVGFGVFVATRKAKS